MKLAAPEGLLEKQKQEELSACRVLAEAWRACPNGKLTPYERPDWFFETNDERIGIEVTELRYTPDGRGLFRQAEESARDKTCRLLTELLMQRDCPPLHVSITFRRYYGLARGSREDALSKQNAKTVAEQIADVLLRHLPPDGISKRLELYGTELFTHVRHLHIDRYFDYEAPICTATDGGVVAALRPEDDPARAEVARTASVRKDTWTPSMNTGSCSIQDMGPSRGISTFAMGTQKRRSNKPSRPALTASLW